MKRCWEECIANGGMTAEECKALIEREIMGHEIPNLQVKIRTPRDDPVFNSSYWYIGIPTNFVGETSCKVNNAVIRYPFGWEVAVAGGGSQVMEIPDTDCLGLMADSCCTKVMQTITAAGIPTTDVNGHCLTCWVHSVPLEAIIGDVAPTLGYLDHSFIPSVGAGPGLCLETFVTQLGVETVDDADEASLKAIADGLQAIVDRAGKYLTCESLKSTQNTLLIATRNVPRTRNVISDLLCGICDGGVDTALTPLPPPLLADFLYIIKIFRTTKINNNQNWIVIYTDSDLNVIEPPKIGGSLKGIDWNLKDDCDQVPDTNSDPETESSTCIPNDPPSPAFCETTHFDPASLSCAAPAARAYPSVRLPGYSVTFRPASDIKPNPEFLVVGGKRRTRFYYQVCTAAPGEHKPAPGLPRMPNAPIDHVIFGWLGVCAVTNYQYRSYAFEETEFAYFGGMDKDTCTGGFGFMESFQSVLDMGDKCAELMMEVDGHVTLSDVPVALKMGQGMDSFYITYLVKGADCSLCGNAPTSRS